jgi:hypothetical protein
MKHLRMMTLAATIAFLTMSASSSEGNYHFESASFTTDMWINNKTVFIKAAGGDVEFATAGAFDWGFSDSNGKEVRTLRANNEYGGWTGMDFASPGLGGNDRIGFRNASTGEKEIKQGDVRLK